MFYIRSFIFINLRLEPSSLHILGKLPPSHLPRPYYFWRSDGNIVILSFHLLQASRARVLTLSQAGFESLLHFSRAGPPFSMSQVREIQKFCGFFLKFLGEWPRTFSVEWPTALCCIAGCNLHSCHTGAIWPLAMLTTPGILSKQLSLPVFIYCEFNIVLILYRLLRLLRFSLPGSCFHFFQLHL